MNVQMLDNQHKAIELKNDVKSASTLRLFSDV